jgi:hypothetical protein
MENSARPVPSDFEPLTLGAAFDVLFYITRFSCPRVTFKVTEGLGNTGMARKNVIMSGFDVLMAIRSVYDDSSDGLYVSVWEPNILGEEGDDLILFKVFWIENGGAGEGIGNCVVRAFDVGDFHMEVGELYTPSGVTIGEVLGFFEELKADVICVHANLVRRGDNDISPFSQSVHDA